MMSAAIAAALLGLSGCTVGPDYVNPEITAAAQWQTELRNGLYSQQIDARTLATWWQSFDDPVLSELIEMAVLSNLDVRAAVARLKEARARRGVTGAALFPTISGTGSATKSRTSASSGAGSEENYYSAGFDASWEIDIFGGIRRSVEEADANLAASQEELYDVLVSLTAELALNYVEVRSYQTRLALAIANRNAQQETYGLVQNRFEAGLADQLEVEQARYNLESTRAEIPSLNTGLEQTKNRLAVLLGNQPGDLPQAVTEPQPIPVPPRP